MKCLKPKLVNHDSAQDRVDIFDFLPPAQITQGHKVESELWLWDILEIKEVVDDFPVYYVEIVTGRKIVVS